VIRLTDLGRLANAVWTMRRRRRLTQEQLAERVGITGMAVSLIELGKSGCKLATLIRIANALGYDLALIPREDAP
jgi:transcriptional regulator with XRE-family HTH domain